MSRSLASLDLEALRLRLAGSPGAAQLHPIGLGAVHADRNALGDLGAVVDGLLSPGTKREVSLLTDTTRKLRSGEDAVEFACGVLAGFEVHRVVLEGSAGRVHADPATLDEAILATEGARCLITLGSGTLADIGKVAAAHHNIPHVVVQSATSVNGFADDQSVRLIDGVKRTTPSRWPDALVIDTELLAGAPRALNLAGIGDLAAMFTAPADWLLALETGMSDDYSAVAVAVTREHGDDVLRSAAGLAKGDALAVEQVAGTLTLSGISMGVAGTTAPSSGMEHTVSHLIDMAMNRRGLETAFHGAQVGVSTVLACTLWQSVLERLSGGAVETRVPAEAEMAARVRHAFMSLDPSGEMGDECWRLYRRKLARWAANHHRVRALDWVSIARSVCELLVDPLELCGALAAGGAPVRFAELDPPIDEATARWALLNCHLMRDRFGVADLAFVLGMWEERDLEGVLDRAAAVGGGI